MQIKLNLKIFIFILIFILTKQIEIYAILMLFAFIHEIGHIVAGLCLGLRPKTLRIMPFGIAVTLKSKVSYNNNNKKVNMKKIIVAFAGPVTNLIIMLIALFLNNQLITYSNLLIALFNLLPIYPLDGGRIIKNFLELKHDKVKTSRFINKISNVVIIVLTAISSILIIYIKNLAIIFIIIYLWYMVIKGNKDYRMKEKMEKIIKESKLL